MFQFYMKLLMLLLIISCDSSSSKNSSSSDQKKEPSFSYQPWSLQKDDSFNTLSLPQWKNKVKKNISYSYQPTVAGLEVDALSGSLKFENLEVLAKTAGQEIRVTAADNSGYSESITLALQVKAHNKAELKKLVSLFIDYVGLDGNYNAIDTSSVKDMSSLFNGNIDSSIAQFNGDISKWDTSQVTDMKAMFSGATAFDQDIDGWNVEKVTSMNGMFVFASAFNWDLDSWNTKSVTDMSHMFFYAGKFNGKISSWNTENVSDMTNMFNNAADFNQDISGWNVLKAKGQMSNMFSGATAFNAEHKEKDDSLTVPQKYFNALKPQETKL